MEEKVQIPSQIQVERIELRGHEMDGYPITKHANDDVWLCWLQSGSIHILYNYKDFEVKADQEGGVYFLVMGSISFSIQEGSRDFHLQVFSASYNHLATLYSYLGSEVNNSLFSTPFVCSHDMGTVINEMLCHNFLQLELMLENNQLLEQGKLLLYLLAHIYLTFYNGIDRMRTKTNAQSFDIMSRFFKILSEPEARLHRDTQYFADRLHITVRHLFQICKNETGHTPKEFINEHLISEMRHTMLTTSLSFQEISLRFNFPDQTAFTQFFKRNTGMTPSEFRQQNK